jgi:hypothetical protein
MKVLGNGLPQGAAIGIGVQLQAMLRGLLDGRHHTR